MSNVEWLQRWYADQCDGSWEHGSGLTIETLDNPGWSVVVDLAGTALAGAGERRNEIRRSDRDWTDCRIQAGRFLGAGGPGNLEAILGTFRRWLAESDGAGLETAAQRQRSDSKKHATRLPQRGLARVSSSSGVSRPPARGALPAW